MPFQYSIYTYYIYIVCLYFLSFKLCKVYKEVCHHKQSESYKMDDKKERVQVKPNSRIILSLVWFPLLVSKRRYFCIVDALASCFYIDKDDDIEEEGDKDEGDASKDPCGEGRQSN